MSAVRAGRNVRGFKLPPQIGFDARRELEGLLHCTVQLYCTALDASAQGVHTARTPCAPWRLGRWRPGW